MTRRYRLLNGKEQTKMIRIKSKVKFVTSSIRLMTCAFAVSVFFLAGSAVFADWKNDQEKISNIKNVHYTQTITNYDSDGINKRSQTWESWVKAPFNWRCECKEVMAVAITNKDWGWSYSKSNNTYSVKDLRTSHPSAYPLTVFLPDRFIETMRSRGASVSEPKKETHNGVECSVVEISVAAKGNTGSRRIVLYVDSSTGFITTKTTQRWRVDGTLESEEQDEYEYNKQDMPDDFFVFQPPADAKQIEAK